MVDLAAVLRADTVPIRERDRDELSDVITAVHAKFPDRTRDEIGDVVRGAYQHLARNATVTAHLIPLTLNRSTRLMRIAGINASTMVLSELLVHAR